MTQYYVTRSCKVGTVRFPAGALVDDTFDNVAGIAAAGGGPWLATAAIVAAAATTLALPRIRAGAEDAELDALMGMAVMAQEMSNLASNASSLGASQVGIRDAGTIIAATTVEGALQEIMALVNAGMQVAKRTVTLGFAELSGLGGGVKTFTKNFAGAVLPANSRFVGLVAHTFTGFRDAADTGAYSLEVGDSAGVATIATAINVRNGQTGFPKAGTLGALGFSMCPLAAGQATIKLTGAPDLKDTTAGAVSVDLYYLVLP